MNQMNSRIHTYSSIFMCERTINYIESLATKLTRYGSKRRKRISKEDCIAFFFVLIFLFSKKKYKVHTMNFIRMKTLELLQKGLDIFRKLFNSTLYRFI